LKIKDITEPGGSLDDVKSGGSDAEKFIGGANDF
jgi:hypothetical protein